MNPLLSYLLQVTGISAILYGYYHLALRNKKFHRYNRFYLLIATVISIVVPFLNIPVYFTPENNSSFYVLNRLGVISSYDGAEIIVSSPPVHQSWFTLQNILYSCYALIITLFALRIILSLVRIRKIVTSHPIEKVDTINFVNTDEPGTPFSFFRWLFWNKKIELQSEKGEQIFRHELFHIEQKHSRDIIFLEILTAIFWLNPFFHLIKKEVKAIHEFLADEFAVTENKQWNYAELLLMQVLNTNTHLVNPFFHNQIKRRIAMITTSQKPRYQYLRKMLVLPLAAIVAILFAFSYKNKTEKNLATNNDKEITVIIDAGHGGEDGGAIAPDGTQEKDITLAIAKKVKEINSNGNINIVLTRESDLLPTLQSRTDLSKNKNASLFISLHINTENKDNIKGKTGFEVYISKKNNSFYNENQLLGTILQNQFAKHFSVGDNIKQRDNGIWVLDQSPCPAALIECGYLTNSTDLAFIKDADNQDAMAKSILESINQYLLQKENIAPTENKIVYSDTTKPDNKVYDKVEVECSFPGGNKEWRVYLERNLDASVPLKNKAKDGVYTVIVQFIVDKEGKISDAKALTKHGYGMEEEGIRVIKKGPKWVPATQNGKIVKAYRKQPITFYLGTEENIRSGKTEKNFSDKQLRSKDELNEVVIVGFKTEITDAKGEQTTKVVTGYKIQDDDNKNFTETETPPSFPGGDEKWRKYLSVNAKGNVATDNGAPEGTYKVIIQFIVNTDSTITDIKATTNHGYGMEEEALRLIKKGPKWFPATQNGHIVKAYAQQPITFQVQEEVTNKPITKSN